MDTSETYIKMCDYPEIQRLRDNTLQDWYGNNGERVIWLPRQDQLQEMVRVVACNLVLLGQFMDFIEHYVWTDSIRHEPEDRCGWSMEQLWLAFGMKENHGKVWSEEKWINEPTN